MVESDEIKAVKWLIEEGLKQIFPQIETKETLLTASSVRDILDEYIKGLIARMDEERIRQLAGGLSQLIDAKKTVAYKTLLTNALSKFHEVAALPISGSTGDFRNEQLRSLAFLGMASAHKLLGDSNEIIAEKIVNAVTADNETAEKFLGKKFCNSILHRILPNKFFQLSGSLTILDTIFPKDRMYYVPPGSDVLSPHFWVLEETKSLYSVGLTRYSAHKMIRPLSGIRLPKEGSKIQQTKAYSKQPTPFMSSISFYAPLSGKVIETNHLWDFSTEVWETPYGMWRSFQKTNAGMEREWKLVQDPYSIWLFRISTIDVKPEQLKMEFANLFDADAYRTYLSRKDIKGTVSVNSIEYTTQNNNDLVISVVLVDHLGKPVSGASIKICMAYENNETFSESTPKTTDKDGKITFEIEKAPSGRYSMYVHEVKVTADMDFSGFTNPDNCFYI